MRGQLPARVYFFPSAQSVPTVSSRLPLRFSPVAIGNVRTAGVRTSISLPPEPLGAVPELGDIRRAWHAFR